MKLNETTPGLIMPDLPTKMFNSGATMRALESSKLNIISNVDDLPRGDEGGYNVKPLGKVRVLYPRLSRADYDLLSMNRMTEAPDIMDTLLGGMSRLPKSVLDSIRGSRKVVRHYDAYGSERHSVVPSVPNPMTEAELAEFERDGAVPVLYDVPTEEQLAARVKARTYRLTQLFTDNDSTGKFEFPVRLVETAKRMTVVNPAAAARYLQDYMNSVQDVLRVRVEADKPYKSRALAQSTLQTVGSHYERTDAMVRSDVCMDQLIMHGPDGGEQWHVRGPLKYANELSYVYWMMFHAGRIFPNILFSLELVMLGINVNVAGSDEEPQVEFHSGRAGVRPRSGLSIAVSSELSAEQRVQLANFGHMMTPVVSSAGQQLGTAVQVTGRHAVMNSHVLGVDEACTIGGLPVVVKRQLSRDIVSVQHEKDSPPWVLREPQVGEWVIVCYLVDDKVSCSQPIKIISLSDETIVMSMDVEVGPGVSGGAVVALEDMALLGVHSAATRANLIAFRFGDSQFGELIDSDSVSAVSRLEDAGTFAEQTLMQLSKRGLRPVFKAAIASMEPIYIDNMHVGSGIHSSGSIYTTCDPGKSLRVGDSRRPLVWTRVGDTQLYASRDPSVSASPTFRRTPNYYEKVFVIGVDSEPYLTLQTEVSHIGVNGKSFVISDLSELDKPIVGGLVMGFDGAFLGVCGERSFSTAVGVGYTCWPIRAEAVEPDGPIEVFSRVFPFLNFSAWPKGFLEEVVTHSSVGKYESGSLFNAGNKPLAKIGDGVMKVVSSVDLRAMGYPHPLWEGHVQGLQRNPNLVQVCHKLGLAQCLRVGPGTILPNDAKPYADMVEALIGAVSMVESYECLRKLLDVMGLTILPVDAPMASPVRLPERLPSTSSLFLDSSLGVMGSPASSTFTE